MKNMCQNKCTLDCADYTIKGQQRSTFDFIIDCKQDFFKNWKAYHGPLNEIPIVKEINNGAKFNMAV